MNLLLNWLTQISVVSGELVVCEMAGFNSCRALVRDLRVYFFCTFWLVVIELWIEMGVAEHHGPHTAEVARPSFLR